MPFLDEVYSASPEESSRRAEIPTMDFLGTGSQIAEHIAQRPYLAREMRYSPSLANRQDMQDFLGPLAAQNFAAEAKNLGEVGGQVAAAGAPVYTALKAAMPWATSAATGTGEALPSREYGQQIMRAWRGLTARLPWDWSM